MQGWRVICCISAVKLRSGCRNGRCVLAQVGYHIVIVFQGCAVCAWIVFFLFFSFLYRLFLFLYLQLFLLIHLDSVLQSINTQSSPILIQYLFNTYSYKSTTIIIIIIGQKDYLIHFTHLTLTFFFFFFQLGFVILGIKESPKQILSHQLFIINQSIT